MKIKTSELTSHALDYAVAIAEGFTYTMRPVSCEIVYAHASGEFHFGYGYSPSTKWNQGGPIIKRERIGVSYCPDHEWQAQNWTGSHNTQCSHDPLLAAMRCLVASKLGDEVDVPEELL